MTVLSGGQLLPLIEQHFGDLGPDAVATMYGIIMAESSGNTAAHNAADPYGGSYGLAQINGVHGFDPDALQDPNYNLAAARQVFNQQGFDAWTTFQNGSFLDGIGDAMPEIGFPDWLDPRTWDIFGGGDDGELPEVQPGDFDPFAPSTPSTATASRAPTTRTVGGVLYQYNPDADSWEPAWRPVAGSQTGTSAASGFTLSSGQTRFVPDPSAPGGYRAVTVPASAATADAFTLGPGQTRYVPDPTAPGGYRAISAGDASAMMAEQWKKDYATATTLDNFLQRKFEFENSQGLTDAAAKTQQQILDNSIKKSTLEINIAQEQRARQQQLQGLASDIGALAADPGDRARYASTVLANSGMAFGQDKAVGDMRTTDSLMPLEALLRQRNDLMGGTPQVGVQMPTALGSGINLAQLGQPQVTGAPDQTPGYTTPMNVEGGQPPLPGPVYLNPDEIKAGAQWAPTQGFEQPAGVGGIDLASILGPDRDLPLKAKGGMEDEAFIAGEAGPEIVIPHGDGKAIILNQEQAKIAGIDLSKLVKFADGGLFDGLIKDQDRGLATDFLTEATTRAKAGTPWANSAIPSPTFASSPGFDPLVLELMASINAMETGVPAASYKYNAALRRPAGVGEAPIRRTA